MKTLPDELVLEIVKHADNPCLVCVSKDFYRLISDGNLLEALYIKQCITRNLHEIAIRNAYTSLAHTDVSKRSKKMSKLVNCMKGWVTPNYVDITITCIKAIDDDCPDILATLVDAFLQHDVGMLDLLTYSLKHGARLCTKKLIDMYEFHRVFFLGNVEAYIMHMIETDDVDMLHYVCDNAPAMWRIIPVRGIMIPALVNHQPPTPSISFIMDKKRDQIGGNIAILYWVFQQRLWTLQLIHLRIAVSEEMLHQVLTYLMSTASTFLADARSRTYFNQWIKETSFCISEYVKST